MNRDQRARPSLFAKREGVAADPLWYKDAIFYEVRARSFFDSDGDGVGDLKGLTSKLDYLADLGVTALWLLPHYPSPGRDDGYDIADYMDVHPELGSLADFDEFVSEAHRRGLRVVTELVLNHTSDQHPWFQRARRAKPGSAERDFYVWSDTPEKYKDARIIFRDFEPSNWSWDPVAKAYFWHRFYAHQPDLNFENAAVHEALFSVVDFWFARGVDGLRLDAVPYLFEEEGTNCENLPATHGFLKKLRAHVDARFPARMLLAEANQWPEDAAAYFGDGDECQMNFHFPIMPRMFMALSVEDRFPIIDILKQTPELHPSCQWAMFLRNHDELTLEMVTDEERDYMYRAYAHESQMRINLGIRRRLAPLVGNDRRKMELLNGLLCSLPGTPVLYYGDEIGMGDNVFLGDRNGVRTPMQWSADRNAGFSRANPQRLILPVNIDPAYHYEALNVEAQQESSSSLLWWTKRLLALRKRFQAFGRGTVEFLHPANPRVLAFIRRFAAEDRPGTEEVILVVANLSRFVQYVELDLSAFQGAVPIELFGRTHFPRVGELPYLLTLGGHAFYWFSIEASTETERDGRASDHGPLQLHCSSISALFFGEERAILEDAMPSLLAARNLLRGACTSAKVVDVVDVGGLVDGFFECLVQVEYADREADTFALPLAVSMDDGARSRAPLAALAQVSVQGKDGSSGTGVVFDATFVGAAEILRRRRDERPVFRGKGSELVVASCGEPAANTHAVAKETRGPVASPHGASVVYDDAEVLKLFYWIDVTTPPEIEVGQFLAANGHDGIVPEVLATFDYLKPRRERRALGVIERFVPNEGTAWAQARGEVGRMYERVLARSAQEDPEPVIPSGSLVALAFAAPPREHDAILGAYQAFAAKLGKKTAELHLALASRPDDPNFAPAPYSPMDQRSKYQSARNLLGKVFRTLRAGGLPPDLQPLAETVIRLEPEVYARFEPLLGRKIDASRIRTHGNLHLARVLFTGKDFVLLGAGDAPGGDPAERRRKGNALRDVASMVHSFHYAAAMPLRSLRREDQERAEAWGYAWQRWTAAAYVRGYLSHAAGAPFLPSDFALLEVLLDVHLFEKSFSLLAEELASGSPSARISLEGILHRLGL